MVFSLCVKDHKINGPREGTVNLGQRLMSVMEDVGFNWAFQEGSLGAGAFGSLKSRH